MNLIKKLLQILVSLGLFAYLLYLADFNALESNLRRSNIFYFILSFILIYPGILLSSTRWMLIFRRFGYPINSLESFVIYWLGSFYNNFLPTSFGGDGFRGIYLVCRKKCDTKSVFGSIVLERGTGLLSIGCINIALAPVFFSNISNSPKFLILEAIIFSFSVFVLLFFLFHKIIHRIFERFFRSWTILRKPIDFLDFLITSLSLADIFVTIALSCLFYLVIALAYAFLFKAIGIEYGSFLLILFAVSINSVLGVLPISFNSIGITEAVFVFIYTSFGMSSDTIILIALLARCMQTIGTSLAGLIPIVSRKYSI